MGIYSNYITESAIPVNRNIFLDYCERMQKISEALEFLCLNEDSTALAIPNEIDFSQFKDDGKSFEETKKKIIEFIKELPNKFIKAVKELMVIIGKAIEKAIEKVQDAAAKVKDSIYGVFSKTITYDNLNKAQKNGWPGLPKGSILIGTIANNLFDSSLYEDHKREITLSDNSTTTISVKELDQKILDIKKRIDDLSNIKDDAEFDSEYSSIKKEINKQKSIINLMIARNPSWQNDLNEIRNTFGPGIGDNGDLTVFVAATKVNYFPTPKLFSNIKEVVENSGKLVNDFKRANISRIKEDTSCNTLLQYKLELKNKDNSKKDIAIAKCNLDLASAIAKLAYNNVIGMAKLIKLQHTIAISTYIKFGLAIHKYAALKEN